MSTRDSRLPLDLVYDPQEIGIVAREDGTVDLYRHDGEAEACAYLDLSLDWASKAINTAGEQSLVFHDDRETAIRFAILQITDYNALWSVVGLAEKRGEAPPINGRSFVGNDRRYRQQDH